MVGITRDFYRFRSLAFVSQFQLVFYYCYYFFPYSFDLPILWTISVWIYASHFINFSFTSPRIQLIVSLKLIMMKKEALKQSNSLNLSERLYDICKSGWMTKRSQNKKRFTPVNYKLRWFELTKYYLTYYDVENAEVSFCFFFCLLSLNFNFISFFH